MPVNHRWTVADVIDFEYYLASLPRENSKVGQSDPDHQWFKKEIEPTFTSNTREARRAVYRAWIEHRRGLAQEQTPGEVFANAYEALLIVTGLAGVIVGIAETCMLLAHPGSEPINAPRFFAGIVLVQWALLLIAGIACVLRWIFPGRCGGFRPLLGLLSKPLGWLVDRGLRELNGGEQGPGRDALALFRRTRHQYRSLTVWPLIQAAQFFGLCFSLAALGTLLWHLKWWHLRFDWQTTFQSGPEDMFRYAKWIATPWKWAVAHAHPTLAEVVATQSQSVVSLPNDAAEPWWPFLVWSVVVWAVIFRVVLLAWAKIKIRWALAELPSKNSAEGSLWLRLRGPLIPTDIETDEGNGDDGRSRTRSETTNLPVDGECIVLACSELKLKDADIKDGVPRILRCRVATLLRLLVDRCAGNDDNFATLSQEARRLQRVVVVVSARPAPIDGNEFFLREVAQAAHNENPPVLLLVGRSSGASLASVADEDLCRWEKFNNTRGLGFQIERWHPL